MLFVNESDIDKVNTQLSSVTFLPFAHHPPKSPPYNLRTLQICAFMSLKTSGSNYNFHKTFLATKQQQLCIYTRDFWTRTTALTDFQGPQRSHVHKSGLNGAPLVGLFFPAVKYIKGTCS